MEVFYINPKNLRINEQICDIEVRVLDWDGSQLGIMDAAKANKIAKTKDLDLVEIAPNAHPPVCKIMHFGKYCYEQAKREKEARKKQKTVAIKEIQLTLKIGDHDLQTKAGHAKRFLQDGDKVKVVVKFRGREMAHTEQGDVLAARFVELVNEIAVVEKPGKLEGRNFVMVLAPKTEAKTKK